MLTLGWTPGPLRLALKSGADFSACIEYQSPPGVLADWPSGMSAWLRLSARGSTFERVWPATIADSAMSWSVVADDVAQVPLNTWAELWLQYADSPAFVWVEGWIETGCRHSGFGYIAAVPLPDDAAVAVPVPGPAGPPGEPGSGAGSVIVTGTAGVALSGHRAVTRQPDGTYVYATCENVAHLALPIGITTGAVASGATVQVVMFGDLTEPSWSWTPGPIFLGVSGALTQSVPGTAVFVAQLAAATAAATVFVDRSPSIALI